MSLCDIEIFKTAVVQKWGPIKLGQWLMCHKESLVNYNQRSHDLFEWYLDFPSFFLFGRDLRKSPLHTIVLDRMPVASMLRNFLLSWYWWVVLQGYMFLVESSCYNSLLLRGYVLLLAASLLLRAFVLVGAMWSRPNLPWQSPWPVNRSL